MTLLPATISIVRTYISAYVIPVGRLGVGKRKESCLASRTYGAVLLYVRTVHRTGLCDVFVRYRTVLCIVITEIYGICTYGVEFSSAAGRYASRIAKQELRGR